MLLIVYLIVIYLLFIYNLIIIYLSFIYNTDTLKMIEYIRASINESGLIDKKKTNDEYNFDSDSDEEMGGDGEMFWHDDFIEAKSSAIKAVGIFAKSAPTAFTKYFLCFNI